MTGSNEGGDKTGQGADFRFPIERKLATEEQLRRIEELAAQLEFQETDEMKAISRTGRRFTANEFAAQVRLWQQAAEVLANETLAAGVRDEVRGLKITIGHQLALLAIALRQGQEEYVDDIFNHIDWLFEEDEHKDNKLGDIIALVDEVLMSLKEYPN